jgi:hypothetical protein
LSLLYFRNSEDKQKPDQSVSLITSLSANKTMTGKKRKYGVEKVAIK